ncbi:hypothetical protein GB931_10880 [Modestobacter sp. I12A-02628]|uniref:Uncharacterized protein n=1 Tax=Goekera deserti TaxID=2497753 RepID=A0A7K3WCB0_9ACTN|nr:hypothetical protein [Goekera deserti]MPQ98411.1 hypothetical protein [Goekera deserti]NDI48238.1 hypothetical protein [Goekera deserti]NEL53987.1 hypothetical protein [Goekera deserti]
MSTVSRHGADLLGHRVELEFDRKLSVVNRARLFVDGVEVDATRVVYGERTLTARLGDGTEVEVALHSGMVGELTRAQLRSPDGSWVDLTGD